MKSKKKLLDVLLAINTISQNARLTFDEKLVHIIFEIVQCVGARSGSIMVLEGQKKLRVVASTVAHLIGQKQPLQEGSPSSWVVKNKKPLHVQNIRHSAQFKERFDHYQGSAFLVAPLINNGQVIGVVNVTDKLGIDQFSRDEESTIIQMAGQIITALENQRLTESLKEKRRILQEKNLELERLETLKTELFNMLIHDLKGPLSELLANLDILSLSLSDENQKFVKAARSGCDTLCRMVSNLLDITRLEEGKMELVYEEIDPSAVIRESIARMGTLTSAKDLRVIENKPMSEPTEPLLADRDILIRILQNLLSNAIRYSPAGETITMGFDYGDTRNILFEVADRGPGIPPQDQQIVFDKFQQLKNKTEGRVYSTGLGLTFCRMAVEAHQGRINVESDGLCGSTFSFELPLGARDAQG
jgi:two-component system sensor histidine kinase KdpD